MKRGGALHARADNDTNSSKDNIQGLVRQIVIIRDGGCIFRHLLYRDFPQCGPVLQADHLITRANSATYSDTRLIVCLCRNHHAWKSLGGNARKAEYDAIVKTLLPRDRVELWERAEQDSWRPHRKFTYDWRMDEAALKQELAQLKAGPALSSVA
jgi:hypothetical protein